MSVVPRGKISIYGIGGCGTNIVAHYAEVAGKEVPGCAIIEPYYLDSSFANVKGAVDPERTFILEEKEGSGKVRTENRVELARAIAPVLKKFPPGNLNIVVSSGSGGSGSVGSIYLTSKLLEDGYPTIVILVGSDECERSSLNTLNTIKSYEGVAQKTGKTVMMYYEHLKPADKRSAIDERIWFVISAISCLASRRNDEMDLKDIENFVNFSANTSANAQLSVLEVYRSNEEANAAANFAVAVASLLRDPDSSSIDFRPEYRTTGYPSEPLPSGIECLHFVTGVEPVHGMFKNISKSTEEIASAKNARTVRDSIVKSSELDDDGMVF
jgi:hypothetical protein